MLTTVWNPTDSMSSAVFQKDTNSTLFIMSAIYQTVCHRFSVRIKRIWTDILLSMPIRRDVSVHEPSNVS
jgi:hypothetical protein